MLIQFLLLPANQINQLNPSIFREQFKFHNNKNITFARASLKIVTEEIRKRKQTGK